MVAGSLLANFFNFVYSIVMVRLLTPSDFGTLTSLNAIGTMPFVLISSISPLVVVITGSYFAEKKYDLVKGVYIMMSKFFLVFSLIICVSFLIFIPQIDIFFKINNIYLLLITDAVIFFTFMTAVNMSFLQSKLAFKFYVFIMLMIAIIKLFFSTLLVFLGFKIIGAVTGLFLSILIPGLLTLIPLRFVFDKKIKAYKEVDARVFLSFGIPTAVIGIGLSGLITSDLILVKHYFNSFTAGLYSGLSLMGRIIFFVSSPITAVMFPLVVRQYGKKENYTGTFALALALVLTSSAAISLFYTFFPEFSTLFLLKKKEYLAIVPYITFFSINVALYSLLFVLANFYLSIKKTVIVYPVAVAALLQIFLIIFFHQNIWQVVVSSFGVNLLLLIVLLICLPIIAKNMVKLYSWRKI